MLDVEEDLEHPNMILGHSTLSATSKYLHASNEDVREVMTKSRS
jgi:site-specific recombinase XerD